MLCFVLCFLLVLCHGKLIHDTKSAVGRIPMKVSIDPQGSSVVDIPIDMPLTTHSLKPLLSIAYHSSKSGTNGLLGSGFYLKGLSNIHPCPKTIFNDETVGGIELNNLDRLCMDGERMILISNGATDVYTTQKNTMTKIENIKDSDGSSFVATRSDGTKLFYGAKKLDETGSVVLSYSRNKVEDLHGNYYTLNYDGDFRVTSIDLTVNARQPNSYPYAKGYTYKPMTTRLSGISLTVQGKPMVSYQLKYQQSCTNGVSQLITLEKCGYDGKCLPTTEFEYTSTCDPKFVQSTYDALPIQLSQEIDFANLDLHRVQAGSFSGSTGLTDFYVIEGYGYQNVYDSIYIHNEDGTYTRKNGLNTMIRGSLTEAGYDVGRYKFIDFSGNGYLDIYMVSEQDGGCKSDIIYINDGEGNFTKTIEGPTTCITPQIQFASLDLKRFRFADFSGNGIPDLYFIQGIDGPKTDDLFLYDSKNGGKWIRVDGIQSSVVERTANVDMARLRVVDFNGDGRNDLHCINAPIGGSANDTIWFSQIDLGELQANGMTGPAFRASPGPVTTLSPSLSWASLDLSRVKYGDFNGDGLVDIYYVTGRGKEAVADVIYMNHGLGIFTKTAGLLTVVSDVLPEAEVDLMRLKTMSFNNDRFTDIYVVNHDTADDVYLCQSSESPSFTKISGPATILPPGLEQTKLYLSSFQFTSLQGSGYLDLMILQTSTKPILYTNDLRDSKLTKTTDGFGEFTTFKYTPLTSPQTYSFSQSSLSFPVRTISTAMFVVSQIGRDDGLGGTVTTEYAYENARYHMLGLGFLGFQKIVTTNTVSKVRKEMTYSQDFANFLNPQLVGMKTYSDRDVLISQQTMTYSSSKSTNPKLDTATLYSVYSKEKVSSNYDQQGNFLDSKVTSYEYDKYWNLVTEDIIEKDVYGVYHTVAKMEYVQNMDKWIMNMQSSHEVSYSVSGVCCVEETSTKKIKFDRDMNTGLVMTTTEMPDVSSLCRTTKHTYDIYGNPITKEVSSCNMKNTSETITSFVTYESLGRYITQKTDPLGFTESYMVDEFWGVNVMTKDNQLNLPTFRSLDPLGRITSVQTFANNYTTTLSWCSSATSPNGVYCETIKATTGVTTQTVYDRLGRPIEKMKSSLEKNIVDSVQYDTLGNVVGETVPYFVGGKVLWNHHEYDVFRRRTKTQDINGNVDTWTYLNGSVTFTNAASQKIVTSKNTKDCVISRTDSMNSVTTYQYDSRNNLVRTTDPKNNHILFEYDLYDRKVSEVDPDAGKIAYTYDYRANVLSKTYQNGKSIQMTYDKLNRMTTRVVDGVTSTFVYDQQVKNTLSSFSNDGFSRKLKYDRYGRISGSSTTIDSNSYSISLEYDRWNRISKKTFPNGVTVCYVYNSLGYLTKTTDCSTPAVVYEEVTDVNSFGSVTELNFGNGIQLQISHLNDNKLTGISSTLSSSFFFPGKTAADTAIQSLIYEYDSIGRLMNRSDTLQKLTESFRYDNLNRVTGSQVNGEYAYDYEYDSIGNIMSKGNVGSYYYEDKSRPHMVTSICITVPSDCFSLKYDDNGNMISQGGSYARTIAYNTENKPTNIQSGDLYSIEFMYDPFGNRYLRTDKSATSATTTYYVGGEYEVVEESDHSIEKVFITNSIVHETSVPLNTTKEKTIEVLYVLRDHLYSVDVITNHFGQVIKRESYDSFGRTRDPATWQPDTINSTYAVLRNGYTNQEELWITGLIHMNGRLYDPQIGRFMSPDPLVQDILNLQNFNRYSYALNNPLVTTDPSGYSFLSHFFHSIGKAIGHLVHDIGKAISSLVHDVVQILKSPIFQEIVKVVITAVGVILAPYTGGASILICDGIDAAYTGLCVELDGGSLTQALESALINVAEDLVTHEIGEFFNAMGATSAVDQLVEKSLVHGVESAGEAELQHQSPLDGFINGFAGSLLDGVPGAMGLHMNSFEMEIYGGFKTGIMGGITSWENGGNFLNGAIQAEKGFWEAEVMKLAKQAWKMALTPESKVVTYHKGDVSSDAKFSKGPLKDAAGKVDGMLGKIGGDFSYVTKHFQFHFDINGVFKLTKHGLDVNCEGTITAFERGGPISAHEQYNFNWDHDYKKIRSPF